MSDPIVRARNGDAEFFKRVPIDQILNLGNNQSESVLSISIKYNHVHCSRVILRRCPSLLYQQDISGNTALHYAVYEGKPAIVNLLIHGAEKKLFRIHNHNGDTPIINAMISQQLEMVKLLIQADPDYEYDATSSGVSLLLVALGLSFGHTGDHISVKIRQLLLEKKPSQCKVRLGSNGWTILHHATSKGDLGAIQDIIHFCPESMDLVDKQGQNFLHIAVKNGHVKVVEYILIEKKVAASLISRKDNNGDTPLDIASKIGNIKIISCLKYALSNVNDPTIAGYENERVKESCVPPKYLELYRKLVWHFGEIAPPEQSPLLDEFLSIVSEMLDITPHTVTQEQITFWESKVAYYSAMGLQISWLRRHITRLHDWLAKKKENISHLEDEIAAKVMELIPLEGEITAKEKEIISLEDEIAAKKKELLHLQNKREAKEKELTSLRVELQQLPLNFGFVIFDE